MTLLLAILYFLNNPERPPTVLYEATSSIEQCLLYKEALENDEEIKRVEKEKNLKSIIICSNDVAPLREESGDKSVPSSLS